MCWRRSTATSTRRSRPAPTGESTIEIYFLSASSIMRNGKPRVWRDAPPFDIASDLLAPYGLGLEMDKLLQPDGQLRPGRPVRLGGAAQPRRAQRALAHGDRPDRQLKDVINTTRRAKGTALTPRFRRPGAARQHAGPRGHSVHAGGVAGPLWGVSGTGTTGSTTWASPSRSPAASAPSRRAPASSSSRSARRCARLGATSRSGGSSPAPPSMRPGVVGCSAGDCIIVDNDRDPEYWYITSSKHTLDTGARTSTT